MSTSFKELRKIVCEEFAISQAALEGSCRDRRLTLARSALVSMAREHTALTHSQIARMMKYGDHTTVATIRKRTDITLDSVARYHRALARKTDPATIKPTQTHGGVDTCQ